MSDIATRIAAINADHARARALAGITGRTTTRNLERGAATRLTVERATRAEREREARLLNERARHAEAARLARRIRMVEDSKRAAESAGDSERAARLELLIGDIESARDRYVNTTFQAPALVEDWAPGGRFTRYARRYDLGFIGYTFEDIAQDAAEILAAAGLWSDGARRGSDPAGHTVGDAYRALRHAYRRGLGFYGYERRGQVVTRDTTERGYTVGEGSGHADIRAAAADTAAAVRALMVNPDEVGEDVDADTIKTAERRARALQTLAGRFPLNADGRMLALATLLTEGYTVEELTDGLGVTERTLHTWAAELGSIN